MTDVWVALVFGFIGFWLRKAKYPLAPLVVAIVLGDATERVLRQSLIMSSGSGTIFFTRPIAAVTMVIVVVLFLLPAYQAIRRRMKHEAKTEEDSAVGG